MNDLTKFPELAAALTNLAAEHDKDKDLTIRISYFGNDTNECWFVTQKIESNIGEINSNNLHGIILTRNQVAGLIEMLDGELKRTQRNSKE